MGTMSLIGCFRHGTEGVIFLVQSEWRHNIIAHVVGDVRDDFFSFHLHQITPFPIKYQ